MCIRDRRVTDRGHEELLAACAWRDRDHGRPLAIVRSRSVRVTHRLAKPDAPGCGLHVVEELADGLREGRGVLAAQRLPVNLSIELEESAILEGRGHEPA